MFVNELLTSVEKGKPIFPGEIFLPFFVLEANNEHICFLKRMHLGFYCFCFFPSDIRWSGDRTVRVKIDGQMREFNVFTIVLK